MLLWDVLARSSAVLVAAALTNAALRGRSAALRHAVWACGLAGALAVAPLSWILPTWHVPLVPAFATATAHRRRARGAASSPPSTSIAAHATPLAALATPMRRSGPDRRGRRPASRASGRPAVPPAPEAKRPHRTRRAPAAAFRRRSRSRRADAVGHALLVGRSGRSAACCCSDAWASPTS